MRYIYTLDLNLALQKQLSDFFSNFLVTNRREELFVSPKKVSSPSFSVSPLSIQSCALSFPGKSRGEDSFGRSLPFRPLGQNDIPEGIDEHRNSMLQPNIPSNLRSSILEPELLTKAQEIEVVLGDSTVLPCRVAHLGTTILPSMD